MTVLSIILLSLALPSEAFVAPNSNTVRPSFAHRHFSTNKNEIVSVQNATVDTEAIQAGDEETVALKKTMGRIEDPAVATRLSRVESRLSSETSSDNAVETKASEKAKPEKAQVSTLPEKNKSSEKLNGHDGPNARLSDVTSFPEAAASSADKDAGSWGQGSRSNARLSDVTSFPEAAASSADKDAGSWGQGSRSNARLSDVTSFPEAAASSADKDAGSWGQGNRSNARLSDVTSFPESAAS